jgi:tetratricopeptide (TPR) repeat protein
VWSIRWLTLILLAILVLRAPEVIGRTFGNVGTVLLVRTAETPGPELPQEITQAEHLFRRAARYAPSDDSSWRGLGFALAAQGREDEAIAAWQNVDGIADDLILLGEQARESQYYTEALRWYQRATLVEPSLGDSLYYTGLVYEGLERWDDALAALQNARSLSLSKIGPSDVYYQIGWLLSQEKDPPDLEAALAALNAAIAQDRFSDETQATQAHYQKAEVLRQLGLGQEALVEYHWVTDKRPRYYRAHVQLGWLYWQTEQNGELAEATLLHAIQLSPDSKPAYLRLATVYQASGRTADEAAIYRQILTLDPADERATKGLERLGITGD